MMYGTWRIRKVWRMMYGTLALNMAHGHGALKMHMESIKIFDTHAHRVWRKRIKHGVCAWSMAHAHGGWSIRLKYGVCVWSMAYADGVWRMRVEYGAFEWKHSGCAKYRA